MARVPHVRADTAVSHRAEELFRLGKLKMAAGDLEAACPALKESYELEPATGSLLALASCHERARKLLTAQTEYAEVVKRALREGREDRMRAAQSKVWELEQKIPEIRIFVTEDFEKAPISIRLNGELLREGLLGTAVRVDGPTVDIEASAAEKQTWRSSFPITAERHVVTVTVPGLADVPLPADDLEEVEPDEAPPPPKAVRTELQSRKSAPRRDDTQSGRASRITGTCLMGLGAASLIAAGGLAIRAKNLDTKADPLCDANLCTSAGRATRLDARTFGNFATGTLAAGAVAAVSGALTFWLGGARRAEDTRTRGSLNIRGSAFANAQVVGGILTGAF
jgi:hypothetical protein